MQTALQVVLPELEGGIEPRVYGGRRDDGPFEPFPEGVERLARRVSRWIRLRRLPPEQRRVALVIFSFPPDKGSIGSAAYLDVFRTVHRLMEAMAREGYRVEVPARRRTRCGGRCWARRGRPGPGASPAEGAVADC